MPFGLLINAAVVSGVAGGVVTTVRVWTALSVGLACASLAVALDRRVWRAGVLLAALFAGAAAEGAAVRERTLASPLLAWFSAYAPDGPAREPVLVDGVLAADAAPTEAGVRLIIDVNRIQMTPSRGEPAVQTIRLGGRIQAHVSGAFALERLPDWAAGRTIRAPMLLRRPEVYRNPGSTSERWQQLRRPFDLIGSIKSGALVDVAPGRPWTEWAANLRRHVRAAASRFVAPHSAQSAALMTAILIGDRAGLTTDVQRRLQAAGTYHVVAISGGNVAILVALCVVVLRVLVRSPRMSALVTMGVVLAYGWLVGGDPSVGRAVAAACLYLGVGLVGLAPRAMNVLGVVAMWVVVTDPLTALDIGAWLSFGATLGIVVGAGRFLRWAAGDAGSGMWSQAGAGPSFWHKIVAAVRYLWLAGLGLLSATLAAEIVLLPVSAAAFSRVSVAGLVLNFIAIPAMAVVQVGGLVTAGLAWWRPGATLAGWITHVAAWLLVDSSRALDVAPWLSWRAPPAWAGWTVIFYAALAALVWVRGWRWVQVTAAALMAFALAAIVTAPGLERAGPAPGWLRLSMLDVGQGDALLVQFPGGRSMAVDTGGAGSFDIGGRVVTPAIWALGVRRLDWLVVTHADLDHIGGALSVAADLRPREIWEGIPVPRDPELRALRTAAHDEGIVWRQLQAGHTIEVGSALVEVVNPPLADWERQRVRNDDSIVLRLRFGDVEFLLTGDAGLEFERRPGAGDARLPLRVLKVGHHGSRSSSTQPFVEAFRPDLALVSVGQANLFGHPAPDVLARYRQLRAQIFRTDADGAVVIDTNGAELDVHTMSGRTARLEVRRF